MPGTVRVVLVRHAETDLNALDRYQARIDAPLNRSGEQQARVASAALTPGRWAGVWSSPTRRATATAARLAEAVGTAHHQHPELIERDLGELDGQDRDVHRRRHPIEARRLLSDLCYAPRGGEALATALVRLHRGVIGAVAATAGLSSGGNAGTSATALLVVTHGGMLNALGLHLLGQRPGSAHHVGHVRAVGLTLRTPNEQGPTFAAVHHWDVPPHHCEDPWPVPRVPAQALPTTPNHTVSREV